MKVNDKSLSAFATTGQRPDKEGYLLKRGDVNKAFQKRWCILKGNLLFYFEKRTDRDPMGFLILDECVIELAENTDAYVFLVKYPGDSRTYTFGADTQEDMESWMRALSSCGYEYMKLLASELQRQLDECHDVPSLDAPSGDIDELQTAGEASSNGGTNRSFLASRFNPFDKVPPSPDSHRDWHDETGMNTLDETFAQRGKNSRSTLVLDRNNSRLTRFSTSQFAQMHSSYGVLIQHSLLKNTTPSNNLPS